MLKLSFKKEQSFHKSTGKYINKIHLTLKIELPVLFTFRKRKKENKKRKMSTNGSLINRITFLRISEDM